MEAHTIEACGESWIIWILTILDPDSLRGGFKTGHNIISQKKKLFK